MATTDDAPRAIALIREEHSAINALFDSFDKAEGDRRDEIVAETILRLDIHAQLKDEILYPAIEDAIGEDALAETAGRHEDVEEALDEFVDAEEEEVDAEAFTALGARMRAHFEEEEHALADLVEGADLDLDDLGRQMETRREELRKELTETGDTEE